MIKPVPDTPKPFRVPPRRIKRIQMHLDALAKAGDPAEAMKALFLLHCACRDCLKEMPPPKGP